MLEKLVEAMQNNCTHEEFVHLYLGVANEVPYIKNMKLSEQIKTYGLVMYIAGKAEHNTNLKDIDKRMILMLVNYSTEGFDKLF